MTKRQSPGALYTPSQHDGDRPEDFAYMARMGLILETVAWANGSPVVTADQFANFIAAWRGNDRNGNWGEVSEVESADAGRLMVFVSGDALACGFVAQDGMTRDELESDGAETSVWPVGDGGVYRMADNDDWDDWAPITF